MNNKMSLAISILCVLLFQLPLHVANAQEQEPDESGIGGTGHESPLSLDDAIFSRPELPEINAAPEIPELASPIDLEGVEDVRTSDDMQPSVNDTAP